MFCATLVLISFVSGLCAAEPIQTKDKENKREALWSAVRDGDVAKVKSAIENGADVNAANEIGVTSLWIAAGKGKIEVINLLLEHGADVNARDGIWYQTPLSSALGSGKVEIVKRLLEAGAKDIDDALRSAASSGKLELLQVIIDTGKVSQDALDGALYSTPSGRKNIRDALTKAGAKPLEKISDETKRKLASLAGTYDADNGGSITIRVGDTGLLLGGGLLSTGIAYRQTGPDHFVPVGVPQSSLTFERTGDKVSRLTLKRFTAETHFYPAKPIAKPTEKIENADARVTQAMNWPQFRGPAATGIADGQHPPIKWNTKDGTNVRWKTEIPGLGHSCPIVWGDRVFLTSAVSGAANTKVRIGNYGDVRSVNDTSKHSWHVLCLDRESGKILWNKTAFEGVPKIKRHEKGSQANCTPVTDGKRVVACFGPEGLYCYDFTGKLIWQRDLRSIDSSFAIDEEYEWGFGSSPVIHDGLVILQFDLSHDSFIAAYSLEDGSQVWATPRDEIPSWCSPTIWKNSKRTELVTNAAQYARGYDPATGKELWRLSKKSEIAVPTPVPAGDLIFVVAGNRPIQPIFAIKPGAMGDISLKEGQTTSDFVAWSTLRGGPYMPTPIVYGPHLYVCSNAGVLTCYETATGKRIYRERIGGSSYTASPVAADGRLYFTSEEGGVRVVKAGPNFELLAANDMGDICMAVPAISDGALFVRSRQFMFCLGPKKSDSTSTASTAGK